MNSEKILVVYYSNTGYTKKLAREIAKNLNCDIEEIKTTSLYSGFFGYQRALFHALFKREPKIKNLKHALADYNLVIVGGPVWAGSISGPVRSFLTNNKEHIKNIAVFLTQGGHFGKTQSFKQMELASGQKALAHLALTDRELIDEAFKQKLSSFIYEIQGKKINNSKKSTQKGARQISPTGMTSMRST
jgi:flavodoxin